MTAAQSVVEAAADSDDAPRSTPPEQRGLGAVTSRMHWLAEGSLSCEPRPRYWLLRGDDAVQPIIPLGEVGLIAGAGGTSKTMALIALGISVALGGQWLGAYHVTPEGTGSVALFLAEESQEECDRRFYYVAQQMKLTDEQKRIVERRVMCAPLAGISARLMAEGQPSEISGAIFDLLASKADNWRLVAFDALSRFAGGDTERDNAAAADFVCTLERFKALPGGPTVACVHHTSQASREPGKDVAVTAVRGVTALVDNPRWILVFASDDETGAVSLRVRKNNYGPQYPDVETLTLKRRDHGVLSVASPDELAEISALSKHASNEAKVSYANDLEAALLEEARRHGPRYKSKTALANAVTGNKQALLKVATKLVDEGRLGFGSKGCVVLADVVPLSPLTRDEVA